MSFAVNHLIGFGGSVKETPATISGLYLWHRADTGLFKDSSFTDPVTADGDTVGGWLDKSGNGRHWSQGTTSAEPTYKTGIVNGKPVLRFDGTDDAFGTGPDFSAMTGAEVFIVVKGDSDPSSANGLWSFGTDAASTHYPFSDGIIYDACFTTARKTVGNPTPALTSFRLYNVVSVSGEWTAFLDGTQLYTTATNTVAGAAAPRLGRGTNSGSYFDGDIAELIIYSAKLGATNKSAVKSYIATRYGLTIA